MGYELHIHRRKDWFDEGDDISLEEWQRVCVDDPSLSLTGTAEADVPEGKLVYTNEGCAVWTIDSAGRKTWFDLRRGKIAVKNPDETIIAKACEIAAKLSARVQGDEGEFYGPDGSPVQ